MRTRNQDEISTKESNRELDDKATKREDAEESQDISSAVVVRNNSSDN